MDYSLGAASLRLPLLGHKDTCQTKEERIFESYLHSLRTNLCLMNHHVCESVDIAFYSEVDVSANKRPSFC